jgi:hypothetical protein
MLGGGERRVLEDLGNLGDFLGGIAVIATLIYVAIQIRQNTRQITLNSETMRLSFENEARSELNTFRLSIAADELLSSIWSRGLADEELEPAERHRFELLLTNVVAMLTAQFHAHQRDLYDLERRIPYFAIVATSPGFRRFWDRPSARSIIRHDVHQYINSLVESLPESEGLYYHGPPAA